MGQVSAKLRSVGKDNGYGVGGYAHWCPGCEEMHAFAVDGYNSSGAKWSFDGDVDRPTFSPSMNIRVNAPDHPHYQPDAGSSVCHYFLKAGRLEFLGDSTHSLAGLTVDLPDLPEGLRDRRGTDE